MCVGAVGSFSDLLGRLTNGVQRYRQMFATSLSHLASRAHTDGGEDHINTTLLPT